MSALLLLMMMMMTCFIVSVVITTSSLRHVIVTPSLLLILRRFSVLARDAFVRTNRRPIAMMFVRPSVCLSVWDGREL